MPPGGARKSKRVRSQAPNERPAEAEDVAIQGGTQGKRIRPSPSNERPPGVATRSSSTRQQPTQPRDEDQQGRQQPTQPSDEDQQGLPPMSEDHGVDWSYHGAYENDGFGGEGEQPEGEEEVHPEETTQAGAEGKWHLLTMPLFLLLLLCHMLLMLLCYCCYLFCCCCCYITCYMLLMALFCE